MNFALINFIFTGVFVLGALYFWLQTRRLKNVAKLSSTESPLMGDNSLLSIQVPKNNERTPLAAEQMFAALHGIYRSDSTAQPEISFEMVSRERAITFYIHTPRKLKEFVLSQVYAQYPTVEIQEQDDDYVQVNPELAVAAAELRFKKPRVYPIKTFVNFEVDPLSAITGVLSSVGDDEQIWTQLVIRPIDDAWQEEGEKVIAAVKEPAAKSKGFIQIVADEAKQFVVDFIKSAAVGGGEEAKKDEKKKDEKPKELGGPVQQALKGIEEKITKLGFEATLRIVAVAPEHHNARAKLEQVVGAYKQFNSLNMNSFVSSEITDNRTAINLYRSREAGESALLLNITELASIYHFPSETVATPTIAWAGSKKGEPPANLPIVGTVPADELTVFAQTNYRNQVRKFGIKKADRRLHSYIIGKTGTGKSTLMENMIFDDIREGRGVAVVDPHGELIDHVLNFIPEERVADVVYFNPADRDFPIGFNILENINPEMQSVVASGVVGIFKKIFGESWGPRLEYILRNAILALLDSPNSTLLGVMRILTDNAYRRKVVNEIKDPVIRDFFINEYEKYEPKFRQEAIAPIQNKVGQFLSSSVIRNIVGQPKSAIDIRQIMDEGKILLADLSTGKIGEDNSALLGSMLITKVQLAAMSRTNVDEQQRRDFYLYVDEFQNFATDSFATILSEARKYRLNLVMINQYTSQMPETVANAVFGNVGTMIAFRVGAADAEVLKKEFEPVFDVNDLVNLPNRQIYTKMAVDGVTVPAFSASTLPPPEEKSNLKDAVIDASRTAFATPRTDVEDYIADWSMPINLADEPTGKSEGARRQDPSDRIVTNTPPQQVAGDKTEEKETESSKIGEGAQEFLKNNKVEILKDRFDRQWYGISPTATAVGEEKKAEEAIVLEAKATTEAPEAAISEALIEDKRMEIIPGEPAQSGGDRGEVGENTHLITWDQAGELGLNLDNTVVERDAQTAEFEPIDELK
ncbi:MAG: type IV secretion system DNA-binding domain-containing protein [Patescibacteria group bacterium]